MTNPFDWDYLTASAGETAVWGPFSIAFVLFFAIGLITALFFSYDAPHRLENRQLLLRTIQRGTMIAIPVFSLGLFFFLMRYLQVSALGLHMRLWLYLMLLVALVMLAYFWYYIRKVYPRLAAAEEDELRHQQYLRRPAHGGASRSGGGGGGRSSRRRRQGRKKGKD